MIFKHFTKIKSKEKQIPVQIRASFWFLICSFLQKGVSVVTTPVFTRLLNTAEYGQYTVFNSWLSIGAIFVSLELYNGVYTQGLVKFDKEQDVFASSLQGLTMFLCVIWGIVYFLLHDFWNSLLDLTTVQMLALLIMIWTSSIFGFWAGQQRVKYQYRMLILVTLTVSLAKPSIGILLVIHAKNKVTARILGLALVELLGYTWMFFKQMLSGKVFFSKKYWKYAICFNLPLIPHYLSQAVLSSADRIMVKQMIGANEAGIYGLAYSISLLMTLFNTALTQTISPWLYQKIKYKQFHRISEITFITMCFVAFANLGLIAFAPEIVLLFAPPEYYDAIRIIPPVAMSVYFMFVYNLFAVFEFYFEKTSYTMMASIIGAVMNIILNILFIPRFGYSAAGYTTLVCYMLYAGCHYYCMKKICRQNIGNMQIYNIKKLLLLTFIFVMMGFIMLSMYTCSVLRYGLIIVGLVFMFLKKDLIYKNIKVLFEVKKNPEQL